MINDHYLARYNKLIQFYKQNLFEGYHEKHHITPKCLGGMDEKSNIVLLPARVHFIAHYILHKAYPTEIKLTQAFGMMCAETKKQKRHFSKTSFLYEKSKIARSLAMRGIPRPEWVREKLRKPKANKENYKGAKSKEHKENISKGLKGKPHHWNDKIVNSSGYRNMLANRKIISHEKKEFHRRSFEALQNFLQLKISRNEYYSLYKDIPSSSLKGYLRGL